ncbi:MAG: glycine cleavage system protein GcvH [Methylotenera sp.]|uniref:glycine cleavage system protein GcvH n=1 Tax=Methylotenera sp. TaxID=2051956 RepID=UPI002488F644|nr:glycine cleavage system protein GcvH [Methylotenera sp.]MDI1309180.1 glycine cleavage system protein GcvH [Methylotenera sp.]
MHIPQNFLYSTEHLWTKASADGTWEAGITDYAQDLLGDIVFIEAPAVGSKLVTGQPCGIVESVKTGSDLHALVDGNVIEINQELINSPELINEKPYQAWIFKYKPTNDDVSKTLLSPEAYKTLLDGVA